MNKEIVLAILGWAADNIFAGGLFVAIFSAIYIFRFDLRELWKARKEEEAERREHERTGEPPPKKVTLSTKIDDLTTSMENGHRTINGRLDHTDKSLGAVKREVAEGSEATNRRLGTVEEVFRDLREKHREFRKEGLARLEAHKEKLDKLDETTRGNSVNIARVETRLEERK